MPRLALLGIPTLGKHIPLVLALGIDAIGAGVTGPVFLLFFVNVAHMSVGAAGSVISVAGVFALGAPVVVGWSVQEWGAHRSIIAAQLLQGLAFVGLAAFRATPVLLVCAVAAAVGQRAFWSSVYSVLFQASDESHGRETSAQWFALASMVQTAGFSLGGVLTGLLLTVSGTTPYVIAFSLNAASFFASGILLSRERRSHDAREETGGPTGGRPLSAVMHDRPFVLLTLGNTLFAVCIVSINVGLPVYVTDALHMPRWFVGPLIAVVAVLNSTCQGAVTRASAKFPSARIITAAGMLWMIWALMMVSLLAVPPYVVAPALVVSVGVFVLAQMLQGPTSNALAATSAPAELRQAYLAYFQYSFAFAGIIAPLLFGWLFGVASFLPYSALALLVAIGVVAVRTSIPRAT